MSADARPVVVVTGAAGAIGGATVDAFLDAGYAVVGLDVAPEVATSRPAYRGLEVDLRDEYGLEAAVEAVRGWGPLVHLVQVAGGALPEEPPTQDDLVQLPPDVFRGSLELNLVAPYLVLRATLPWFRDSARDRPAAADPSATLISSWNGLSAQGMPAYSAAKAGLIGMMHALVRPLGAEGIRCNVVAPGTIRTPRTERIWAHEPEHFERLAGMAATGRLGVPEDVGRTCLALARDLTHVCGQVLVVDGGQGSATP